MPPILSGYGAGAALTYAALAQELADRFHAGVADGFLPGTATAQATGPGAANLDSATLPDNKGVLLKPSARLPAT